MPSALAASAAAAAPSPSCGHIIRTFIPLVISDSTFCFSLAEEP